MSMHSLEREICFHASRLFANRRLKIKDLQEWSTGKITPQDGEITEYLPYPGVFVTVKVECDKRAKV